MSMFSNYIDDNYIPNNTTSNESQIYISQESRLPLKLFNAKNKLVALCWDSSDEFKLKVSLKKVIYVEKNAIILSSPEQKPDDLIMRKGLKAYNTADSISWTCVDNNGYLVWSQDANLQYPINGIDPYIFTVNMDGKDLIVEFTDHKYETLQSYTFMDTDTAYIDISLSKLYLDEGIYYIKCYIDDLTNKKLIDTKMISIGNYYQDKFKNITLKSDVSYKLNIHDGDALDEDLTDDSNSEIDSKYTLIFSGGEL